MALPVCLPDPDGKSIGLDCAKCEPHVARGTRLLMHCGYLPRAEWPSGRNKLPKEIDGQPYTHDTCPGYMARQPEVEEAAHAYAALEAGILDRFDPLRLHVVTEAALLCKRAFNLNTAARMKESVARAKAGR